MPRVPRKTILPAAAMEKLLKKAGAERVSEDAKAQLIQFLEEIAEEVGDKANRLARHAGRKTVKGVDILEATK